MLNAFKSKMIKSEDDKLWARHCGFLDLSLPQFMTIQETLLLEQLRSVGNTALGKRIIGDKVPTSLNEFRKSVPLTTFVDYLPEMGINNEDALPEKPYIWAHTSGQGTSFMDVPYTLRFYNRLLDDLMAIFILSCSNQRGQSSIQEGDRVLFNVAPSPYLGGILAAGATERFNLKPVYSPDAHDGMDFKEKIVKGFEVSLQSGVDITIALTSVLVKMGKDFNNQTKKSKLSKYISQPGILYRYAQAFVRSKINHRGILPKDLWPMKALIGWGMDTSVYREQVYEYWGKYPYEFHACTEAGIIGMQSWTRKDMTFVPYTNLLEFIPESEWQESKKDSSYKPRTVLLSEVEAGKRYELVITNFQRMPFIRYRLGHLIRITSLQDEEARINLPQMVFEGRADDLIDVASFTRLSEKTITQAMANTGKNIEDWVIRKEVRQDRPVIAIYAELGNPTNPKEIASILHQELKKLDYFYDDLDSMMGIQPIEVIALRPGTFSNYSLKRQQAGAEISQLKPRRINAPDEVIEELKTLSSKPE
ncbi:MAG: GH3 auxin-responsive promoter family protein [Dehalococcoidales bacterium]|nr:GH3 auxin-responsive promoter family protein [Dehalococcoidales bacterium]